MAKNALDFLDVMDRKLIHILSKNGLASTKEISNEIGVTVPTVHARRRRLLESGILKIAGLVDTFKVNDIITALVALNVEKDEKINDNIEKISKLNQVTWVGVVTGRYDIIVEVLLTGGMPDLYRFTTEDLARIGNIQTSESFVIMKSINKWTLLPNRIQSWFTKHVLTKK